MDSKVKFCSLCRKSSGAKKPIESYDKFEGFKAIRFEDNRDSVIYEHRDCGRELRRAKSYVALDNTEFLVCERCNNSFNKRINTELGSFDSTLEYLYYKQLLNILPKEAIMRQITYNELFSTGTKHSADFYIPSLDLVLEVTSSSNNLSASYKATRDWKLSVSPKVRFAYSIAEVEDIVRPLVKAKGLNVGHCRNVLCRRTFW